MPNAGDINEYGQHYFPGIGWSGGTAGDQGSFADQGFAGVGGQPPVPAVASNPNVRVTPGTSPITNPMTRPPSNGDRFNGPRYMDTNGMMPNTFNSNGRTLPNAGGLLLRGGDPGVPELYNTGALDTSISPMARSPFQNFRTGRQLTGGATLPEVTQQSSSKRGYAGDTGNVNTMEGTNPPVSQPDPGLAQIGLGGLTGTIGAGAGNPYGTVGPTYEVPGQMTDGGPGPSTFKDEYVNLNGQQMIRVGHLPQTSDYFRDLSKLQYDPQYGYVTTPDNVTGGSKESFYDKYAPWLMMAGAGLGIGAEAMGAFGGTSALAPEAAAGPGWAIEGGGTAGVGAGAAGATGVAGGGAAAGAGSSLMNGLGRVGGAIAGPLLRGITGNSGSTPSGGGNGPTGLNIGDLISGGVGLYQDNKSIQDIKQMMWEFYNRGDYNSQYRPGYLARLNQLENDPSGVIENDTGYKNMRAQEMDNEARALNARGFNMSGNEQGEIAKLMKNMDTKYINDAKSSLRSSAGLGSPEQMAAAAMRNLPMFGQMQSNRNAAASALAQKFLGGKSALDWLNGIFNGTVKASDLPPNFEEEITNILNPGGGAASSPEDDPWGWWAGGDGWEGE